MRDDAKTALAQRKASKAREIKNSQKRQSTHALTPRCGSSRRRAPARDAPGLAPCRGARSWKGVSRLASRESGENSRSLLSSTRALHASVFCTRAASHLRPSELSGDFRVRVRGERDVGSQSEQRPHLRRARRERFAFRFQLVSTVRFQPNLDDGGAPTHSSTCLCRLSSPRSIVLHQHRLTHSQKPTESQIATGAGSRP